MLKNVKRLLSTKPSSSNEEWNVYMRYKCTGPSSEYRVDVFVKSDYIYNFTTDHLFVKDFGRVENIDDNISENNYIHFVLQRSGENIEGLGLGFSDHRIYSIYRVKAAEVAEANYEDVYTEEFYKDIQYSMIVYKLKKYNKPILPSIPKVNARADTGTYSTYWKMFTDTTHYNTDITIDINDVIKDTYLPREDIIGY